MQTYDILKEEVSIYDLFDLTGQKYETAEKPCQISCPFHGEDTHPSARVFPENNDMRCYYCSKSWNSVTYWAQINGWYTKNDKLDIGRSIDDLCDRFGILNDVNVWEKRFHSLKADLENDNKEIAVEDRLKLRSYYAWKVSVLIHEFDLPTRKEKFHDIIKMWDDLEEVSLDGENWQEDLKCWYESAKVVVNGRGL